MRTRWRGKHREKREAPIGTHPPTVTIAARSGAAGSQIGTQVAHALGVPFLDREIPQALAARTGLGPHAVEAVDEPARTMGQRAVAAIGRASTLVGGVGGSLEQLDVEEAWLRAHIEEFLARSTSEGGVALGRGGMIVLRCVPWALHVHLGGPKEGRVARRAAADGLDRATAEARLRDEDRARMSYVRRAYGVDGEDPRLYHLMVDTVALDIGTSVDLIVTAARSRAANPVPTSPL